MKAFVLAAGLGTRLKPWTEKHPKALVPVGGVPMLERVLLRLKAEGFTDITVNAHHFADQIKDFLGNHSYGLSINISDESDLLLDTGGGMLRASEFLGADDKPFLVHNVDILSDAPLADIMESHIKSGRDISLVTSPRDSSRRLLFNLEGSLAGWHNLHTGKYRPAGFTPQPNMTELAFSGIYVVNPAVFNSLADYSMRIGSAKFPIMDFLLDSVNDESLKKPDIGNFGLEKLNIIDIGKPETLAQANLSICAD